MARYCALVTNEEDSPSKFFHIYIVRRSKGERMYSNLQNVSTSSGYEIYSNQGLVASGPVSIKYIGFSFALVAAERKAERMKQKRIKNGYTISLEPNGETIDLAPTAHKKQEEEYTEGPEPEERPEFPKLFDKLPRQKQEITSNQKIRFESLIE